MLSYVLQLVSIDKRMDALPDPCGLLTCLGALFCHNLIFYNRSKDAKEGDSFGLARVSISESASRELTFIERATPWPANFTLFIASAAASAGDAVWWPEENTTIPSKSLLCFENNNSREGLFLSETPSIA